MNELDKVFRSKLGNYAADVPDSVWEHIDQELQNASKKTQPNLWWVASLIGTLVVLSIVSFFIVNPLSNTQQQLDNNDSKIIQEKILNTDVQQQPTTASAINLENQTSTQVLTSIDESQSDMVASSLMNNSIITSTEENRPAQHKLLATANALKTRHVTGNQVKTDTNTGHLTALTATNQASNPAIDQESRPEVSFMPILDWAPSILYASNSSSQDLQIKGLYTEPIKACPFNMDYRDKSLDIYFSYDYIDKQLTAREGGAALKDMRTTTESPMFSFSAGVRLGYNLSYRWNIHTGLNYSQINEKFEYADPESSKIRIVIVKDYIYENGQIVDSIVKQEEVLVPGSTELTIYNKFRTLDVPVLGRYTIMANRHLSLSVMGGVFINITSFEKGTIISDATHKPVELSRSDDHGEGSLVYKNQLGLSAYGSLSMAYHIGAHTDLLVEPYARIQPESITVSTYPLYQKFNRYGLNLGLRYKF